MVGYAVMGRNLTVNPGDIIAKEPQTIEEKAKQIAVDVPDITGGPYQSSYLFCCELS